MSEHLDQFAANQRWLAEQMTKEATRKAREAMRHAYAEAILSAGKAVAVATAFAPSDQFIEGQVFFQRTLVASMLVRAGADIGEVLR